MFAPKAEDVGLEEAERGREIGNDEAGGETNACNGLNAGADEQPDTVTV